MSVFTPNTKQINFAYDLSDLVQTHPRDGAVADMVMSQSTDLFDDFLQVVKTIDSVMPRPREAGGSDELDLSKLSLGVKVTSFWLDQVVYCMARASDLNQLYLDRIRPLLEESVKPFNVSWFTGREETQSHIYRFKRLLHDAQEIAKEDERFSIFDSQGNPNIHIYDAVNTLPDVAVPKELNLLYERDHGAAANALNALQKYSKATAQNQAEALAEKAVADCLNSKDPLYEPVCIAAHPRPGEYVAACLNGVLMLSKNSKAGEDNQARSIAMAELIAENPDYVKHGLAQDIYHFFMKHANDSIAVYQQADLLLPMAMEAHKHGLDILGIACAFEANTWYGSQFGQEERVRIAASILRTIGGSPYPTNILGTWYLHTTPVEEILKLRLPDQALTKLYNKTGQRAFLCQVKDHSVLDRVISTDLGL